MSKQNNSSRPNDQRANALNPNNPAHKTVQDNRANQLNPNNPAYQGGAKGNGTPAPSQPKGK